MAATNIHNRSSRIRLHPTNPQVSPNYFFSLMTKKDSPVEVDLIRPTTGWWDYSLHVNTLHYSPLFATMRQNYIEQWKITQPGKLHQKDDYAQNSSSKNSIR